jgi:hypothetical protein
MVLQNSLSDAVPVIFQSLLSANAIFNCQPERHCRGQGRNQARTGMHLVSCTHENVEFWSGLELKPLFLIVYFLRCVQFCRSCCLRVRASCSSFSQLLHSKQLRRALVAKSLTGKSKIFCSMRWRSASRFSANSFLGVRNRAVLFLLCYICFVYPRLYVVVLCLDCFLSSSWTRLCISVSTR